MKQRDHCSRCDAVPRDIMILECYHPLCLGCASVVSRGLSSITCYLCGDVTTLDADITAQLQQLREPVPPLKLRDSRQIKPLGLKDKIAEKYYPSFSSFGKLAQEEIRESAGWQKSKQSLDTGKSRRKLEALQSDQSGWCQLHPQYELIYFCLTCQEQQKAIVCPECVIHGSHKDHNVETIKKHLSTSVKRHLTHRLEELSYQIQGLTRATQLSQKQLFIKNEQVTLLKATAIQKYQKIRQQLAKQEADVVQQCQQLLEAYSRQFRQIQQWVQEDMRNADREKRMIERILRPISQGSVGSNNHKQKAIQLNTLLQYLKFKHGGQGARDRNTRFNLEEVGTLSSNQQESQIEVLTDRIECIKISHQSQQHWQPPKKLAHANHISPYQQLGAQERAITCGSYEDKENQVKQLRQSRSMCSDQEKKVRKRTKGAEQNYLVF